MTDEELMFVGQKAIINKNGRVLIINHEIVGLDFPGGKYEKNDHSIIESLKREVREETGLEVEVLEPYYVSVEPIIKKEFKDRLLYLVYFNCKYIAGEVKLSKEHSNPQWVGKDNYRRFDNGTDRFKALELYFET